MTGIASNAVLRVRGDYWEFPISYTTADGTPIPLTGYTIDSIVSWPAGSVALGTEDVDLDAGVFTLVLDENDNGVVPEGRTAKLFVRVVHPVNGPETLAIVPLHVVVP